MALALTVLDTSACGSLYVASLLVCFYALAAGPTGPDDLLVASASPARPHTCLPLIHGVRLIRQAFPPSVLFVGALAALDRGKGRPDATPWRAPWEVLGAPRLRWERPLARLKDLVDAHADSKEKGWLGAVRELIATYEAFYGHEGAEKTGAAPGVPPLAYRHVMRWLYVVDESFVASLQRGDDVSLLLLAHFAPLLQNHRDSWFMRGWSEQLILAARAKLSPWYMSWMEWPLDAAGLLGEEGEEEGEEEEGESKEGGSESLVWLPDFVTVYPSP
ncbi:hypothetical protein B0T11DRAFT_286855 [Plectosphaerella cucumerina]|uniref:Uncharacterized protein n=1 Tax=Plectosphaerella cucumerina TaxID=40658 RepID=A0A8K0TDM1_9PEZI|nr:hypothetical protein B0T11DRAFT_286855 [Plectosphaerella cucumerina]